MKREALILARHKARMTQGEVAKKIGLSTSSYSKIENNEQTPMLKQIKLLIKLLKININML